MNQAGSAQSTNKAYEAAIAVYDKLMYRRDEQSFEELTEQAVKDDNLKYLLVTFAKDLIECNIPDARYLSGEWDLKDDSANCISATTKAKYFGKVRAQFQAKFPRHPLWFAADEYVQNLHTLVQKGGRRIELRDDTEGNYDSKTYPWYPRISDEFVRQKHRQMILRGDDGGKAIDMETLLVLQVTMLLQLPPPVLLPQRNRRLARTLSRRC